ncbi:purP [Acrasis kona]|uniref:PurP n=1 Tax=Acrasis kona TaxID=1008807 RepID=A0AAW2YJ16_9EUKA
MNHLHLLRGREHIIFSSLNYINQNIETSKRYKFDATQPVSRLIWVHYSGQMFGAGKTTFGLHFAAAAKQIIAQYPQTEVFIQAKQNKLDQIKTFYLNFFDLEVEGESLFEIIKYKCLKKLGKSEHDFSEWVAKEYKGNTNAENNLECIKLAHYLNHFSGGAHVLIAIDEIGPLLKRTLKVSETSNIHTLLSIAVGFNLSGLATTYLSGRSTLPYAMSQGRFGYSPSKVYTINFAPLNNEQIRFMCEQYVRLNPNMLEKFINILTTKSSGVPIILSSAITNAGQLSNNCGGDDIETYFNKLLPSTFNTREIDPLSAFDEITVAIVSAYLTLLKYSIFQIPITVKSTFSIDGVGLRQYLPVGQDDISIIEMINIFGMHPDPVDEMNVKIVVSDYSVELAQIRLKSVTYGMVPKGLLYLSKMVSKGDALEMITRNALLSRFEQQLQTKPILKCYQVFPFLSQDDPIGVLDIDVSKVLSLNVFPSIANGKLFKSELQNTINLYKNPWSTPGDHRENAPLSAWSDVQKRHIPTPEPYGASLNTPKTSTSIIGDEILCVHNPGSIFEGQKVSDYNYKSYLIIQDKNIKDGISQNEIDQEVEKVVKHFPEDVPLVFLLVAMNVSLPNIDPNNMFHRYLLNVKRTDGTVSSVWVIVLLKEGMREMKHTRSKTSAENLPQTMR